jgi:hypothetical protein
LTCSWRGWNGSGRISFSKRVGVVRRRPLVLSPSVGSTSVSSSSSTSLWRCHGLSSTFLAALFCGFWGCERFEYSLQGAAGERRQQRAVVVVNVASWAVDKPLSWNGPGTECRVWRSGACGWPRSPAQLKARKLCFGSRRRDAARSVTPCIVKEGDNDGMEAGSLLRIENGSSKNIILRPRWKTCLRKQALQAWTISSGYLLA